MEKGRGVLAVGGGEMIAAVVIKKAEHLAEPK